MGARVWVLPRLHLGVAFAIPADPQASSSLIVGAVGGRPALPRKVKGLTDWPELSVRKALGGCRARGRRVFSLQSDTTLLWSLVVTVTSFQWTVFDSLSGTSIVMLQTQVGVHAPDPS